MSNINDLRHGEQNGREADYKKLYVTAMNRLTDIYRAIEAAQLELEKMYLGQTEPS